jgi:hypothetical protein
MIELEIMLLVVLAFVGVGVFMEAYILNEMIQDIKEIKYMLEKR